MLVLGGGFLLAHALLDHVAGPCRAGGGGAEVDLDRLDDGEALRIQQRADDFSDGGIEDDGGELRREVGARDVFLKAALVGEGVFGIGLGEFREVLAVGELFGEVLGERELGFRAWRPGSADRRRG